MGLICKLVQLLKCDITCRHMWVASKDRLNVHFNPASLLSFGDALAFANTLLSSEVVVLGPQGPELVSSPTHGPGSMARLAAPENAPKMTEQMAVNADLTSRIPQKYLIQNQSGLRVYYWADDVRPVPPAVCPIAGLTRRVPCADGV